MSAQIYILFGGLIAALILLRLEMNYTDKLTERIEALEKGDPERAAR